MQNKSASKNRFGFKFAVAAGLLASNLCAQSANASTLHAVIKGDPLWSTYKQRFVKSEGRIIDNANGNVSHSEGQGFGMLMAIAADDPATFAAMWDFTSSKLGIRKDKLLAWRWKPALFSNVRDKNNATDGDILVAWALLEAAEAGYGEHYRSAGMAILQDVKKLIKHDKVVGRYIMPGAFGFAGHQHGGKEIINLSYWVFPAFERISQITKEKSWLALSVSGETILDRATNNRAGLPADWNTLKRHTGKVGTSHKFNSDFSYNAVRVPLYLAWSKSGSFPKLEAFQKRWVQRSFKLQQVNVRTNFAKKEFRDIGYHAIAAVVNCSVSGQRFPKPLRSKLDKLYYPASLQMLSIIATKQRYPQCW